MNRTCSRADECGSDSGSDAAYCIKGLVEGKRGDLAAGDKDLETAEESAAPDEIVDISDVSYASRNDVGFRANHGPI